VTRGARLFLAGAGVVLSAFSPAFSATTWLQARAIDTEGRPAAEGAIVFFGSGAPQSTLVTVGSYFVLNGLVPGSSDRLCINSSQLGTTCGEYRDLPLDPAVRRESLVVPSGQVDAWRLAVSVSGDGTSGQVYGEVQGALGNPIGGADIALAPDSGIAYAFDSDGTPVAGSTTGADGRFLFLNTTAGEFRATATIGTTLVGLAYGRAVNLQSSGVRLPPPVALSGQAVDWETGAALSGTTVAWDFDPAVTTVSSGSGAWSLTVAEGLTRALRGSRPGYRDARTFQPGPEQDPAALTVGLLSDPSYGSIPAAYGLIQAPSLGMILGRVVDPSGFPLAGAAVTVDPDAGQVRYFNAAGTPDGSLTATSSSGRFAVFNVPVGLVAVSVVAPGGPVRSAVAPTIAGGVTQGDLRAFETQTVVGRLFDQSGTVAVGGALVQVVEYPALAVISRADGVFTLEDVPKNTLLSLRAAKDGYIDTYSFRRDSGAADGRTQSLFLVSSLSVSALYADRSLPFDQTKGLISTSLRTSTGFGLTGMQGTVVPTSGFVSYPGTNSGAGSATSTLGNINILSAIPGECAVAGIDPRSDYTTLALAPVRPGAATVDALPIACDVSPIGLGNIYPCGGTVMNAGSKAEEFYWNGLSEGKWQVQFSSDPEFTAIAISSRNSNLTFLNTLSWKPSKARWKNILALGLDGSPIYWRILQRLYDADGNPVDTVSTPSSFTVQSP